MWGPPMENVKFKIKFETKSSFLRINIQKCSAKVLS